MHYAFVDISYKMYYDYYSVIVPSGMIVNFNYTSVFKKTVKITQMSNICKVQ